LESWRSGGSLCGVEGSPLRRAFEKTVDFLVFDIMYRAI
jgi:hypothetical protein